MTNQTIKPRRRGTTFHKTVALLEKSILHKTNVKIYTSHYIQDKVTKRGREHDIVLYFKEKHHTLKVAIECKDWNKKIGSPQIEAFVTKCQDTLIDRGIMVSSLGFTKPAIIKARDKGIDCLMLEQVESLHWQKAKYLEKQEHKLIKVFVGIVRKNNTPIDFAHYEIIDKGGNVFSEKILRFNAEETNRNLKMIFEKGIHTVRVPIKAKGFQLRNINDKSIIPISEMFFDLTIQCIITKIPFLNYRYTNQDSNTILSDLSVAKTEIKNTNIAFTMVSGSSGINLSIHTENSS